MRPTKIKLNKKKNNLKLPATSNIFRHQPPQLLLPPAAEILLLSEGVKAWNRRGKLQPRLIRV
jgi:hypothetical protein